MASGERNWTARQYGALCRSSGFPKTAAPSWSCCYGTGSFKRESTSRDSCGCRGPRAATFLSLRRHGTCGILPLAPALGRFGLLRGREPGPDFSPFLCRGAHVSNRRHRRAFPAPIRTQPILFRVARRRIEGRIHALSFSAVGEADETRRDTH